jgi:alkylated DNA repair dioxygenase AlkB
MFGGGEPAAAPFPDGFRYEVEVLPREMEATLLAWMRELPVRDVAARFAGMAPARLQQALVTEYGAGAGIGWHRDKAVFGEVVGLSLLSPCRFRLRRRTRAGWERVHVSAEARSAHLPSGAARTEWEHSIPPVEELRYSVTFRNLRE